ncbi:hypothetical protein ACJX0J_029498, partial [Zea mays]
ILSLKHIVDILTAQLSDSLYPHLTVLSHIYMYMWMNKEEQHGMDTDEPYSVTPQYYYKIMVKGANRRYNTTMILPLQVDFFFPFRIWQEINFEPQVLRNTADFAAHVL